MIEVWREGDRVLIDVPSTRGWARSGTGLFGSDEPYDQHYMDNDNPSTKNFFSSFVGDEGTNPEPSGRTLTDDERAEVDMLAMSANEWLVADLLALRRQAVDLSRSVDETLAYVAEKCAAIEKS